jgi:nicotinate-nucleotide adenylyltransferase
MPTQAMDAVTKIGLMGGTFDPIHFGHLRPALDVAEHLQFDHVRFIPANIPPHRALPGISAEHRREMVRLAIQQETRFRLDTRELDKNDISYTVETLQDLRKELGQNVQLFWLLGMDAVQGFTRWHRWQEILQLTHLVVSHRPGYQQDLGELSSYRAESQQALLSAKTGKIYCLPVTQLDISATMIRKRLSQGLSINYLMPQATCQYIQENQLYQ